MLYFRNERRHGTGNSEDAAILILEFDDVTVTTFVLSSGVQKEVQLGIQFEVSTFCTVIAKDLLKSPFNSTHELSL